MWNLRDTFRGCRKPRRNLPRRFRKPRCWLPDNNRLSSLRPSWPIPFWNASECTTHYPSSPYFRAKRLYWHKKNLPPQLCSRKYFQSARKAVPLESQSWPNEPSLSNLRPKKSPSYREYPFWYSKNSPKRPPRPNPKRTIQELRYDWDPHKRRKNLPVRSRPPLQFFLFRQKIKSHWSDVRSPLMPRLRSIC